MVRRSEASSSSASSTGPAAATKMNCGALSMCVKASAHNGDATWFGFGFGFVLGLGFGFGLVIGLALRVACGTTARGPLANVVAHHLWNRLERSNHRHGLTLSLGLGFVGNHRIGDVGRAVRPRRRLPLGPRRHGSSSRVRSAARSPESLESQPQEAEVVSCGGHQGGTLTMPRDRSCGGEERTEVRQRTRAAAEERDGTEGHRLARVQRREVEQEQVGGRAEEGPPHL